MYVSAIVLAAGKGLRLKSKVSKPLVCVGAQPIILYCLNLLNRHPLIKDIIVVINKNNRDSVEKVIQKYGLSKITKIVLGGKLRQDSVYNGLKVLSRQTELVLIHDSVRPFIAKKMVTRVIEAARKSGAAIAAVPLKPTIKIVTLPVPARLAGGRQAGRSPGHPACPAGRHVTRVKETLKRDELWEVQTPQVFKKDLIFEAYRRFFRVLVTDDAALVEKLGVRPSVVLGSYHNIKITTPEDLVIAEAILKSTRKVSKIN